MSRLGDWSPTEVEDRVERMEALASIRQLAVRYALAVDSRDLDALVDLFVPDVRVGRSERGRDALRRWYADALSGHQASVHFVANHIVSFATPSLARGVVYCRDELERQESGEWQIGMLQYWDTYALVGSEWCFERRRFHRWYIDDALQRPAVGSGVGSDGLTTKLLPEAFRSLSDFWRG
jgi:hypothetical protein